MKATVWGCASRIGGLAAHTSLTGRIVGGHSYDELEAELPENGIEIDLDHDGKRVGEMVYGEIADDGRLNVVAVLDDDRITRVDEDVFWSSEMMMIGDVKHDSYIAKRAELRSLALTCDPLTVGAWPVRWRTGDVRSSADRGSWAGIWREPLLQRAVECLGSRSLETRSRRLVDLRERDTDFHGLKPGDRAPSDWNSRVLPNGLWRSAHAGRVLRVS
jgi:hypothetical protein